MASTTAGAARHSAGKRRVHAVGTLMGRALADAYAAMDCFVFASQTETQGLVLAEAMAAGKPVVAIDGPGVREIVNDGENGILLAGDASADEFAASLRGILIAGKRAWSAATMAASEESAGGAGRCSRVLARCGRASRATALGRGWAAHQLRVKFQPVGHRGPVGQRVGVRVVLVLLLWPFLVHDGW